MKLFLSTIVFSLLMSATVFANTEALTKKQYWTCYSQDQDGQIYPGIRSVNRASATQSSLGRCEGYSYVPESCSVKTCRVDLE